MSQSWGGWKFSLPIEERVREFAQRIRQQNIDSAITQQWQYLKNIKFEPSSDNAPAEPLNETNNVHCDIEGLIDSIIEAVESGSGLNETRFEDMSTNQLSRIFTKVGHALTDSGFTSLCKIVSAWENEKLLNICFDNAIRQKILEKEEATLSTTSAVKELGRSKSKELSKCIIKLLTDESNNFRDCELLEQVFDVFPNNQKEDIIRAIIQNKNFNENHWCLLQVLSFKSTSYLQSIIMFMSSRCDEFADSQAFARLLVHICKNLPSDKHKDVLMNVIERNHSLLKHQAMKYLSAV